MAGLNEICGAMYRVKDQGDLIKKCGENPSNLSLDQTVLEQIEKKCGSVMPLNAARECASELGLSVPDSAPAKDELGELLDNANKPGQVEMESERVSVLAPQKTELGKCNEDYIAGKIDEDDLKKCMLGIKGYNAAKRMDRIDEIREERKELTPWGRFALKFGVDARRYHAFYKGAFKEWNAGHSGREARSSDDGTIDKGWRPGTRIALTTEPGLTRLPWKNILFRGTLFDVTVYDSKRIEFDTDKDIYHHDYGLVNDFQNNTVSVFAGENIRLTLLDAEFQIPLFERNFFEIGTSLIKEDLLWWKNSNPLLFIPTNIHLGINWQFQGTPVTVSDRVLDVTDMAYILSSYTMFGLSTEVAGVNLYQRHKAAEFCSQAADDCGGDGGEKTNGDFFPYGQPEGNSQQPMPSGVSFIGENSGEAVPNDSSQFKLRAQLFGEQRWNKLAMTYRAYTDFYQVWKKIEAGGDLSFHVPLGRAMEFYIEGGGRKLWSYEEDDNVSLPDDGFELGANAGLGFRPSAVF